MSTLEMESSRQIKLEQLRRRDVHSAEVKQERLRRYFVVVVVVFVAFGRFAERFGTFEAQKINHIDLVHSSLWASLWRRQSCGHITVLDENDKHAIG